VKVGAVSNRDRNPACHSVAVGNRSHSGDVSSRGGVAKALIETRRGLTLKLPVYLVV
jgi:hypothetical protein